MKQYYVVDCISGCRDGVEPFADIADARKQRDLWNKEDNTSSWIIVDADGNEVS